MDSANSQNDTNPLKDLAKELEMLQRERLKAIESCEFSKARAIDVHVDRLRERINATKKNTSQIQNVLAFELKKEEVQLTAIQRQTQARDAIFAIRQEFQDRQMTLHRIHTETLTSVADQYSSALEIESMRLNPQSETMVRQAKLHAKDRNYTAAESLFTESTALREQSSVKRQEDVDHLFESRKQFLEKKHQKELELCISREQTAIDEIVQKYNKEIAKLKNVLAKEAIELQIELSNEDIGFLDDLTVEQTDQISQPLTPKKTPPRTSPKSPRSGNRSPLSGSKAGQSPRTRGTPTPTKSKTPNSRNQTPTTRTGGQATPTKTTFAVPQQQPEQSPAKAVVINTGSPANSKPQSSPKVGFSIQ